MKRIDKYFSRPLQILLVGLVICIGLFVAKRSPEARVKESVGALVRVHQVEAANHAVRVRGNGTVRSLQEAKLAPEVRGRVTSVSEKFVEGGFFAKDEVMFSVEDKDYQLQMQIAASEVAQTERDLEITKANSRIAVQEWELMKGLTDDEDDTEKQPNSLVLFEPQLKSARAKLGAAKARLEQAELNLKRTKIRAPFNCFVQDKNLDVGQYVREGEIAASVVGTDVVEVLVPLPVEDIRWVSAALDQTPVGEEPTAVKAQVSLEVSGKNISWPATVSRVLANVDERGRMRRVAVQVKMPYAAVVDRAAADSLTLAVGSFANVTIEAGEMADAIAIPRAALREEDVLWLVAEDSTLVKREVVVARLTNNTAFISQGLTVGDRVILTNLMGAATGMKLRVFENDTKTGG